MLVFVECLYLMGLSLKFMVQTAITSLVPRPRPAFNRLQYGKAGRAQYLFSCDEKLMNVGGLNDNSVIAHALVPPKLVREFVCFMPSNRALRLPCKVYVFGGG